MTHVSEGWAFLIARGRRAVYRTVLAPGFLVDANLHHLLATSTGTTTGGPADPRQEELDDARVGVLSIGYTTEPVTCADLDPAWPGGDELLTDEHGRPLEIVYGIVSRDRLERPLDAEDLRTARAHALQSYRSFLADEDGHQVDASVAFPLRTHGRPHPPRPASGRTVRNAATGPAPAGAPPPSRPARPRPGLIAATLLAVALLIAGLMIAFSSETAKNPAVDTSWLDSAPTGPVRVCSGTDVSGVLTRAATDYNGVFAGSSARLNEVSPIADSQHDAYLKLLTRGSDICDVISLDVVYVAEFAARDLLMDMTPYLASRQGDFDDRMMQTARYQGKLWGVPKLLDVGVLYYRTDRARRPRSWQDVYEQARARGPGQLPGLRLPIDTYEGLTVVLLELAYAAGAHPIVTQDGKTAQLDQPQVRAALRFLRNAIRDRVISRASATDQGTLSVYELGRARFLRGWPYVWARLRRDAHDGQTPQARRTRRVTYEHTAIVPLPPWHLGGQSVGVLGGQNLVIPRSAPNPSAALRFIDYVTSDPQIRKDASTTLQYPVLNDVANDPTVTRSPLIKAIKATRVIPRPSIPQYAHVSTLISRGVKAILDRPRDDAFADSTLKQIQRDVQHALNRATP